MLEKERVRVALAGRRISGDVISHLRAKSNVAAALKGLLSNEGVKPVAPAVARKIEAYARDRFGSVIYAPWLLFYATYRGAFVEGWVPDNFFQEVAIQRINGNYHLADNARTLQYRLVGSGVIPDIAHFVSGEWRGPEGELWDRTAVVGRLFGNQREICVKTEQSSKGEGVRIVDRDSFRLETVEALGNFVVQRLIRQNDELSAIFPHAVTTIRVSTAKLPGRRPFLLFANLRMGRGDARTVTLGSIKVPIMDADGALDAIGVDSAWLQYREHPDTGFKFEGARVPGFAQMRDDCLVLHDRLPQFGFIGWDVTIDQDGETRLMEINTGHTDIKFAEATVGPCMGAFNVEQYVRRRGKAARATA